MAKFQDRGLIPPAEHFTLRKRLETLVILSGGSGLVVGSVVLLGWLLDIASLKGVLPGFALMQPNTALALALAGLSLLGLRREVETSGARGLYSGLAGLVALIGIATLVEYGFAVNLGIDQLLLGRSSSSVGPPAPGRMSLMTAAGMACLGSGLVLLDSRGQLGRWVSQAFGLSSATIALLALIVYAYGFRSLYAVHVFSTMALHTALTLLMLGIGTLASRPQQGLMRWFTADDAGGWLLRNIYPLAVLIPLILGGLRVAGETAGLYDNRFGAAVLVLGNILTLFGLLWWTADRLSRLDQDRRRVEGSVRDQEQWLRTTMNSIGDAVIATDGQGNVRFMNPVAEGLTGWTQAEAAGLPLRDVFVIVNEKTRKPVESPVDRVIREGKVVGLANHTIVIARDGTETAIEDSAAPIQDATGAIGGVVMVFQDATERRRHEAVTREGEERFRQLAESIPQLAWMAQPDGHIFWYNQRWYDYTGTTPEGMEGWGWKSVHDPDVLPSVIDRWTGSIATGKPFDMTFPLKGVDGEFRPFLTRVMPLRSEHGEVVRWFGTNTDITETRQLEVALRTAKEEAETANMAKDQFLAVLSHELRTPLNPILLAVSSMLERPIPPEELGSTLMMIRQNVHLQARLIDDLLDVMRIVRGKLPLHWGVSDCHDLIKRAVEICKSEVQGRTHKLVLDMAASEHYSNADSARLQQVFWNLIKNAVKFTPEGGTITVRTFNPVDDPKHVVIEVSDTGIGIESNIAPYIFDPFQQGETTITRKFGGLGLGLAICKGVVDAHGGTLTVESPGKGMGTTFRVVLKTMPMPESQGDLGRGNGNATADFTHEPLNVLLVEDEPSTLRLMTRLLAGLGHRVTAAATITDAWEAFREGQIDLIVSDVGLPDGTGHDLMRRVGSVRPVPAIALTGYGMDEDIVRSREAGFTMHMTKPIDFTKLEAMIRQVTS